jgi:hypothetical protein
MSEPWFESSDNTTALSYKRTISEPWVESSDKMTILSYKRTISEPWSAERRNLITSYGHEKKKSSFWSTSYGHKRNLLSSYDLGGHNDQGPTKNIEFLQLTVILEKVILLIILLFIGC